MSDRLKRLIGNRVRAAREARGLTQEQLASEISRTPESVSKIERGLTLPDVTTLLALATALQKPLTELLDDMQPRPQKPARRQKLEARLFKKAAVLSDDQLSVAIELVEVLGRRADRR